MIHVIRALFTPITCISQLVFLTAFRDEKYNAIRPTDVALGITITIGILLIGLLAGLIITFFGEWTYQLAVILSVSMVTLFLIARISLILIFDAVIKRGSYTAKDAGVQ